MEQLKRIEDFYKHYQQKEGLEDNQVVSWDLGNGGTISVTVLVTPDIVEYMDVDESDAPSQVAREKCFALYGIRPPIADAPKVKSYKGKDTNQRVKEYTERKTQYLKQCLQTDELAQLQKVLMMVSEIQQSHEYQSVLSLDLPESVSFQKFVEHISAHLTTLFHSHLLLQEIS